MYAWITAIILLIATTTAGFMMSGGRAIGGVLAEKLIRLQQALKPAVICGMAGAVRLNGEGTVGKLGSGIGMHGVLVSIFGVVMSSSTAMGSEGPLAS